ncbi:MAG TPA: IPTL-CTERM sorting domain-containing protein [Casimicrobiaceae bacterium]|nr:IPTL-CTERM sorting domain-containing protein [Casimicrobiaceae bacterium]
MKTFALALVATLGLLSTPVASQNLITNGSFEAPIVSPTGFTDFPVGSSGITGWTVFGPAGTVVSVVGGSFSQLGVTFPAQNGVQWLDLTGNGSNAAEGVQQSVTTIAGRQYQLTFYLGNTTGGGIFGSTSTVNVLVNGTVAFTDTNSAVNATSLTWQQFSHTFIATGSSTTIGFRNADPATDNSNALDDVVLIDLGGAVTTSTSQIPTLSEWALMVMIATLACLGVARLRRGRGGW